MRYFESAQQTYIEVLNSVKSWLSARNSRDQKEDNPNDSTVQSANAALNLAAVAYLPKLEIETFSSDPMKYHGFIATFEESVRKYCDDGGARLTWLLQYTDGAANQAIQGCAMIGGSEGYRKDREILEGRFGNRLLVSEAMTSKLRRGKPVKSSREIQELSDNLNACVITLKEMGRLPEIDTQNTIVDIAEHLPRYLQLRWKK